MSQALVFPYREISRTLKLGVIFDIELGNGHEPA